MKISELVIGELYQIKPTTKKQVVIDQETIRLSSYSPTFNESKKHRESYYVYLGTKKIKVEKKIDSKRKEVYTYKPHVIQCIATGEVFRISGYYLQTFFIKPTK